MAGDATQAETDAAAMALDAIDRSLRLIEDSIDYPPARQASALEFAQATFDEAQRTLLRWGRLPDFDRALARLDQGRIYVEALAAAHGRPV